MEGVDWRVRAGLRFSTMCNTSKVISRTVNAKIPPDFNNNNCIEMLAPSPDGQSGELSRASKSPGKPISAFLRTMSCMSLRIEQVGDNALLLWIKAVPGASRDQIAGVIGDRLKVRISAPPEAGKANKAICELIARALKLKPRQVRVEVGPASAEKVLRIDGSSMQAIQQLARRT